MKLREFLNLYSGGVADLNVYNPVSGTTWYLPRFEPRAVPGNLQDREVNALYVDTLDGTPIMCVDLTTGE